MATSNQDKKPHSSKSGMQSDDSRQNQKISPQGKADSTSGKAKRASGGATGGANSR